MPTLNLISVFCSQVQGVKILFYPIFLAKSYFVLFFWEISYFTYFLAILPLILVFHSLYNHYFMREHSFKIF